MTKHYSSKITPTQRMLNAWAVVLIIWAVYRAHFKTDLPMWVDEFIAKPMIFLAPLYYYIKNDEHKEFFSSLGFTLKHWKTDIGLSMVVGTMFLVAGAAANYFKSGTYLPADPKFLKDYPALMLVGVAFASALWEEILMRGFVLKRLYEESKKIVYPAFFNSFLFFFLHIPILFTSANITGYLILQVLAMDIVLSLMISFLFLYQRSVWVAILIHFFYNLSLYFFL